MFRSKIVKLKPRITVWLLAGLGNRLRTIDSAVAFCDKSGQRLEIIWPQSDEMVASFDDLFERVADFQVIPKPVSGTILDRMMGCGKLNGFVPSFIRLMPYDSVKLDEEISDAKKFKDLEEDLQQCSSFLRTCHPITEAKRNYDWLKPVELIARQALFYDSVFNSEHRVVGVHIRRTDHVSAIQQSPDELFFKYMRLEIERMPTVKFFLFTDDEKTCERFCDYFGDSMIIRPKLFGRDSVAAIQDALVDWLLLSKCSTIFHSYWSSFSYTASLRYGHKLVEISVKNDSQLAKTY
jgi:hypothetical protein